MGCSVGRGYLSAMSLWGRRSSGGGDSGAGDGDRDEIDARTRLERKMYLARESPEPVFDLSGCRLRQVPAGIYSVCRVLRKESLLLHDNCLKSLDDGGALADLYLLTALNLSANKFSKIDRNIRLLINLRDLNLSNNHLSRLPESFGDLANLQTLDISQNSLKELPKSLGRLKLLRVLKLSDNPLLSALCPELCGANNLISIELDAENFTCPPPEVTREGTTRIMMFLCERVGATYEAPADTPPEPTPLQSPDYLERAFHNELAAEWEEREAAAVLAETELHEAAKLQRERFLSEILKEQGELDAEISKIHGEREVERLKLIREVQEEERAVAAVVDNFICEAERRPEVLQQQLEHERAEHERLLDLCRDNYRNLHTADVLRAMEATLQEQVAAHAALRLYEDSLGDVKRNTLLQELDMTQQLERVLKLKDETHLSLVESLLRDQDVQKAAVASLLERVDARSWSLNQEISIVASNLAKLSAIEQDKRRLEVTFNYNRLLQQRVQLLELLDDLLEQQSRRRGQLVQTLKDMERATDYATDFWLANYQRLMDSAPKTLLDSGRTLDPLFANYLLQEGVIHCLPFLVKFIFSEALSDVTADLLKQNGVNLNSDREGILRAIRYYIESKIKEKNAFLETEAIEVSPSAPPDSGEAIKLSEEAAEKITFSGIVDGNVDTGVGVAECVICMDARSEVVFTPCGHLCCCIPCADKDVNTCPMCRVTIEKKIRVIIP